MHYIHGENRILFYFGENECLVHSTVEFSFSGRVFSGKSRNDFPEEIPLEEGHQLVLDKAQMGPRRVIEVQVAGKHVRFSLAEYKGNYWNCHWVAWEDIPYPQTLPGFVKWGCGKYYGFLPIKEMDAAALRAGVMDNFNNYPWHVKRKLLSLFGVFREDQTSVELVERKEKNQYEDLTSADGSPLVTYFSNEPGESMPYDWWADPSTGERGPCAR